MQCSASPPFFSDLPLDRAAHLRDDPGAQESLRSRPDVRVSLLHGSQALVAASPGSATEDAPLTIAHPPNPARWLADADRASVFLGLDADGLPHFGVALTRTEIDDPQLLPPPSTDDDGAWHVLDVRRDAWKLCPQQASILAYAAGMLSWRAATSRCPDSGEALEPHNGGHMLRSPGTGRRLYPRIDPAVIMLVTCGDWLLLGRSGRWDAGRYSLLAGYGEVGETLEQTVAREVAEEAGVAVDPDSIQYRVSQPWPFPRSLMIGFSSRAPPRELPEGRDALARVLSGRAARAAALESGIRLEEVLEHLSAPLPRLTVDPKELEDAQWIHRSWLRQVLPPGRRPPGFSIPGPQSLAHRLIREWLTEEEAAAAPAWAGDALPDVAIDNGVFKYVLLRLSDGAGRSKLLVRGDVESAYHMHVFQACKGEARRVDAKLRVEPLGGGRIEHHPEQKVASIYGVSMAFGAAVHEVTAELLRRHFPLYGEAGILVSYEGY